MGFVWELHTPTQQLVFSIILYEATTSASNSNYSKFILKIESK